jgi:excisionase family DNA binding protein
MESEVRVLLSRPTISVDDAGRVLGIGRNLAYEAVRNGEIESTTVGKRRLVLTAPLRRKLGIMA